MPSRHQTYELLKPAELPGEDELPQELGPKLESSPHPEAMTDLVESLIHHLETLGDRSTHVAGKVAPYVHAPQTEDENFRDPDLRVIRGLSSLRPRRSSVVWKKGRRPDLVIELLSSSTGSNDRNHKMSAHAQTLRVQEYLLLEPVHGRLEACRLDPHDNFHVVVPPSEGGTVECAPIDRRLGLRWEGCGEAEVPRPRWQLPEGAWLLPAQERAEGQQRAERERQRAGAARPRRAERMEKLCPAGLG